MNAPVPAEKEPPQPSWVGPAVLVAAGSVIGLISLALFCYAYGLNLQDEGWSESSNRSEAGVKQAPLMVAFAGVLIATVIFWIGFVRLTRQHTPPS